MTGISRYCAKVVCVCFFFLQSLNYDTIENELHWQEKEKPNVKVILCTLPHYLLIPYHYYIQCVIYLSIFDNLQYKYFHRAQCTEPTPSALEDL